MKPGRVYKILDPGGWAEAQATGVIAGSALDRADGYIHLSAGAQVAGTLARHFAGESGLMLVAFDAPALGAALRWEPSRGGDLFPHHYGPLRLDDALWAVALPLDPAGAHVLPDGLT